jgi:hypothetical protein
MIAILSALWPLFALATDQEERERGNLRTVIAAWIALGQYDCVIETLGVCPFEPLMEKFEQDILKEKEANHVAYAPRNMGWREDLDVSYQFLVEYFCLREMDKVPYFWANIDQLIGPEGQRWAKIRPEFDYRDVYGLIMAYKMFRAKQETILHNRMFVKMMDLDVQSPGHGYNIEWVKSVESTHLFTRYDIIGAMDRKTR